MKPLNKKNYGSIPHLLGSKLGKTDKYIHEGQHKIMTEKLRDKHDRLIITEKYDGSNVGITNVNGNIYAITRSGYLAETSPYKQHHYFAEWVKKQKDRFNFIKEGERITGEWLMQVHSLKYEILNEPFIAFDYFNEKNERLNYKDFGLLMLSKFNIPRIIFVGHNSFSIEKAMSELNTFCDYRFKTEKPEGLVYRIERKGKFDFAAKYVRSDFIPGLYLNKDESKLLYNIKPNKLK
jgi:ATP-dependent RNA circularization protein (DNA/RNA ligase family)